MEGSIRSVAIIESDAKIRREILQYLKELDVENAVEFESLQAFEKAMFADLGRPVEKAKPASVLSSLSPDAVKYLNQANLSQEKPFADEFTSVEIVPDKSQILKVDVAKIFGRTVPELVANNIALDTMVVAEFQETYKSLLVEVVKSGKGTAFICFKNDKKDIWGVQAKAEGSEKSVKLTLQNVTLGILKELGRIETPTEEPESKKSAFDVIIFRSSLADDSRKWVTRTAALLKKAELWPSENRPRFVTIRYEEEAGEKSDINHPFIDDLLFVPFDRLIFLQKLELIFSLPKKVSPSFLFVQETNEPVEIAKRVRVERINDLGLAMVNPVPLSHNTPAHFYFRFPGQKQLLEVWGKVTHSTPHPEREGDQLVYFSFFGLSRPNYREIRQYLNRDVAYKPLLDNDPQNFEFNPDSIFQTDEQKRKKTVVVLDYDEAQRRSTVDTIKKEIQNIDIVSDDTFFSFFKKYLDGKPEDFKTPAAVRDDFYADIVSFLVSLNGNKMQMPLSVPNDGDKFLGHTAKDLFADQDKWMELFSLHGTRNLLTECFHLVQTNKRINKIIELKCADGEGKVVNVEFILEEGGAIVRLNLSPVDPRQYKTTQQLSRIESLEAIVMDVNLLTEDVSTLLNSVKEACTKNGITIPSGGPRIIVYAAENQKISFEKLLNGPIAGFLYKPLEIRRLVYLLTQALESQFSLYVMENIGWKQDVIHAKIGKDATLVEISEFGAMIESDGPLKPGTMLFMFKSIYQNAPDQNLCVRVYNSVESDENGKYLNSVVYFGITDAFLKFTRSYIRDSYASKKSQDTGKS